MIPAFFGAISAGALGTADFMGRFSSRAIGHHNALLGMLSIGVLLLTVRAVIAGEAHLPSAGAYHWLVVSGVATTAMTLLLYLGLARGPVNVVAPIVAAHPVLVVLFYAAIAGIVPSPIALAAMTWTILGTVVVASCAEAPEEDSSDVEVVLRAGADGALLGHALRTTTLIAVGSSFAYAVLIVAGQAAAPIYGESQTLWYSRIISLITLLSLFGVTRRRPRVPLRWWPFVAAQGVLDAAGYMALFAGSTPDGKGVVTVVASTFGAVTVLLARFVLKERILPLQWLGIALVFSGVVVLSLE